MFIAECSTDKHANIKSYKWCEISLKLYAVFKVNKNLMKQGMYSMKQGMLGFIKIHQEALRVWWWMNRACLSREKCSFLLTSCVHMQQRREKETATFTLGQWVKSVWEIRGVLAKKRLKVKEMLEVRC